MRLLIYTPTNARAVDMQSVMELFVQLGHEVFLLSQTPEGDLHKNVAKLGVKTFTTGGQRINGIKSYLYNIKFLKKFVRQYKIEVVFAHLQGAGFVAGLVALTEKFRFFYVRHNTDEHILQNNRNAIVLNWLTNKVTPAMIAPSEKVYNYLTTVEKVSRERITRINYGYNFNQYLETDRTGQGADIRKKYNCRLLLLSVARLIPAKRHHLMFKTIRELLAKKMDVKLICISDGPIRSQLEEQVKELHLEENVFLLGAQKNVFDYLEASDVFFHLSETEASNSAVKEAGYCRKTALVCADVGDFDDYIKSGVNGYVLDKANPVPQAVTILEELYNNPLKLKDLGENLHQTIITEFDISRVKPDYIKILGPTFKKN